MAGSILIVGGTGRIGQPVARHFQQRGYRVHVVSRDPDRARRLLGESVRILQADLRDPDALRGRLRGIDGVLVSVAGPPGRRRYARIERDGPARLCRIAREEGVGWFGYVSGLGASPEAELWMARVKWQAEQAIQSTGLACTIFRPTWFMEALPEFVRAGRFVIPGRQPHPLRWIAGADFARMVEAAMTQPQCHNKTYEIFGPEALTFEQAASIYCRIARPTAVVRHVPLWLFRLAGLAMPEVRLAATLLRWTNENPETGDPQPAWHDLGQPTITVRDWAGRLAREQEGVPAA